MDSGASNDRVAEIRKEMRRQLTGQTFVVEPAFDAPPNDHNDLLTTVKRRDFPFIVGDRFYVRGVLLQVTKITKKYVKMNILAQEKNNG